MYSVFGHLSVSYLFGIDYSTFILTASAAANKVILPDVEAAVRCKKLMRSLGKQGAPRDLTRRDVYRVNGKQRNPVFFILVFLNRKKKL